MSFLANWPFWDQALERAIKSAAQAPIVVWFVGDRAANVLEMDWELGLGVAGAAALLSLLTSIGSGMLPAGGSGSPSLVNPPADE